MAEKKQASPQQVKQYVKLSDLNTAQVKVQDEAGNLYYLDAVRPIGMYILRPIPKQEG